MLVLGRKQGEAIVIGDIRIVVVRGENVRIGIDAPPDVNIVREELVVNTDESPVRSSDDTHSDRCT